MRSYSGDQVRWLWGWNASDDTRVASMHTEFQMILKSCIYIITKLESRSIIAVLSGLLLLTLRFRIFTISHG